MANFYDQNPGMKNEFAQTGAQHDAAASGSQPATAPQQPSTGGAAPTDFSSIAGSTGYNPSNISSVDPSTDPMFQAAKAGIPTGDMSEWQGGSNPWSIAGGPMGPGFQGNPFSISGFENGGPVGYDAGGAVDDGGDDLDTALQAVNEAFEFGKQKHGLGGQQQADSAIPAAPGNPSDSGAPRPLPMPGPLPPTNNPFGKRNNPFPAGKMASAIPAAPGGGGDSPRPLPAPGPLPPTSNPFGKRNTPFPAGKTSENDNDADDEAA